MSQVTNFDVPGSPLNMSALATALEAIFAALGAINRGATAPPNPFEGMLWWDSAATVEILKRYTVTAGWISILSVNRSTGAFDLIPATDAATASMVMKRDSGGRAKVVAPAVAADIALKSTVTADIATHQALTAGHSATNAATASRIALRDASGNIKIGTAAADTDALNRITADGRFTALYTSGSSAAGGNITGTFYWSKIGNIVFVSWGALTHDSAASRQSAAGVIPAGFRPAAGHYDQVYFNLSGSFNIVISTAGTVTIVYYDTDGAPRSTDAFLVGSTHYVVA